MRSSLGIGAVRVLGGLTAFLVTPILVDALGHTKFGVYALYSSVLAYLAVLEFGLSASITLHVADALRDANLELIRHRVHRGVARFLVTGTILAAAVILLRRPLVSALNIPSRLTDSAAALLAAAILLWTLQKIILAFGAIFEVQRRYLYSQMLPALGFAIAPIVVAILVGLSPDLLLAGAGILTVAGLLPAVIAAVACRRELRVRGRTPAPDAAAPGAPTRFGPTWAYRAQVQVNAVADLVAFSTDRVVASTVLGVASVGTYEFAARPASLIRMLVLAPVPLLFSALAGSRHASQASLVTLERVAGVLVASAGLAAAVTIACAPALIWLWLGATGRGSAVLLRMLCAGYAFHVTTGPYTAALKARGTYRLAAQFSAAAAVLNVVFTIALTPPLGLRGIVLGTALGLTPPTIWFLHRTHQELSLSRAPLMLVLRATAAAAVASALGALVCQAVSDHVLALIASSLAAAVTYLVLIRQAGVVDRDTWDKGGELVSGLMRRERRAQAP